MSAPVRRLRDPAPVPASPHESELGALEDVSAAVEAGAGLPEVVRAAARALDASLLLCDPAGAVLAVAARSKAEEGALGSAGRGVESIELRLRDELVGAAVAASPARDRPRPRCWRCCRPLLAGEADRARAPEWPPSRRRRRWWPNCWTASRPTPTRSWPARASWAWT